MVIGRMFRRFQNTPTWVAGLHVLPGEVHYAWFATDDPGATEETGERATLEEALEHLVEWESSQKARFAGVAVNVPVVGAMIDGSLKERLKERVVEVTALPWAMQALAMRTAPLVGAVVDRRNIAVGIRPDGRTWVCGDWSDVYSRTGALGSVIYRAAAVLAEVLDGRSQPSGLRTVLPSAVERGSPEAFFEWVDKESRTDVAGSLRVLDAITASARSGDLIAERLVNLIASDIGRTIAACIEQLSLQAEKLRVFVGGRVLERMPNLRPGIIHRVQVTNPSAHIEVVAPVQPALALARALAESGALAKT